jgi:Type IV secretion-system coupling protein DNA-binding domain
VPKTKVYGTICLNVGFVGSTPIRECKTVDSCQFLARALIPAPQGADSFGTGNAQNIIATACFEANKEGKTLPEIAERILLTDAQTLVNELTNSKYREGLYCCRHQ